MEKTFEDYSKQFEQIKLIVSQYDADLSLKANKATIFEIEERVIQSERLMQSNMKAATDLRQEFS
jgi:hypothetical protein